MLFEEKVDEIIVRKLALSGRKPDLTDWKTMLETARRPDREVTIGIVGKYLDLNDAYKSIYESLAHAGMSNRCRVNIRKIAAEEVVRQGMSTLAEDVAGILVPGGFGVRGVEGKIAASKYAREQKIPYYGLCLGMQVACIDFARNVLGLSGANSTEFDEETPHPVIHMMEHQRGVKVKGGTMRLGAYPCVLQADSHAATAYGEFMILERHRHRFEFNNLYRKTFEERGVRFSGLYPDMNLVEIFELVNHPWFVGVQFHPEFKSKPMNPHPLFREFIRASLQYSKPKSRTIEAQV
jgi:CTP synthase